MKNRRSIYIIVVLAFITAVSAFFIFGRDRPKEKEADTAGEDKSTDVEDESFDGYIISQGIDYRKNLRIQYIYVSDEHKVYEYENGVRKGEVDAAGGSMNIVGLSLGDITEYGKDGKKLLEKFSAGIDGCYLINKYNLGLYIGWLEEKRGYEPVWEYQDQTTGDYIIENKKGKRMRIVYADGVAVISDLNKDAELKDIRKHMEDMQK